MERIGNYVNQSSYYDRTAQADKAGSGARTAGAGTAKEGKAPAPLSAEAKKLLKELKKSYGNMDFIVADYGTAEEAASYLSRGTSEYSALLTTDELEKMAADERYKKETLQTIDNAVAKLDGMKEKLGDKGDEVTRLGIAIGNDGEVSFFAELEKAGEKQRERIERQREDRREAEKEAGRADRGHMAPERHSGKRTTVFASSVEELAEKISRVDWNTVKEERYHPAGGRFDFTV